MPTINTYLNFNGNTEEAFNFYKSVFGGEFKALQRFKETPDADKMPANEQEKIMYIALPIGSSVLMGTDVPKSMPQVIFGTHASISIDATSLEEGNTLFEGLSAGGNVLMPFAKMFWESYFGLLTDKFGVQWMMSFDPNQNM